MPQTCRYCLKPITDFAFPMTDSYFRDMLESLKSIKVAPDDFHSTVICLECLFYMPRDYRAQQVKIQTKRAVHCLMIHELQNELMDHLKLDKIAPIKSIFQREVSFGQNPKVNDAHKKLLYLVGKSSKYK